MTKPQRRRLPLEMPVSNLSLQVRYILEEQRKTFIPARKRKAVKRG